MRHLRISSAIVAVIAAVLLAPAALPAWGQQCVLLELQKLSFWDGSATGAFFHPVSVSGNWAMVGAPQYNLDNDAAYVFRHDDNATPSDPSDDFWVQEAKLRASDAVEGDRFGESVSINGDRTIIGAFRNDSDEGAAYVFRRDDNGTPSDATDDLWIEEAKLTASDATWSHWFGRSVAISADHVLVGAIHASIGDMQRAGSAYVFRLNDNGTPSDPSDDFWIKEDKLAAQDAARSDLFGHSVSIDGDLAIVGAIYDDEFTGSAYIFRRDDHGTPSNPSDDFWIQEAKVRGSDTAVGDYFGFSVSISGDWAVVGSHSGAAYMFRRDDSRTPSEPTDDYWIQEAKLVARGHYGFSVCIAGDRVIVGAVKDDNAGSLSGSAYVFQREDNGTPTDPSDDSWIQTTKLVASDASMGDQFGHSVSVSGDQVFATGVPDTAYVFTLADYDGDGHPDGCDYVDPPQAEAIVVPKNRYLSFVPTNSRRQTALRVVFKDLPPPYNTWNDACMWVGGPAEYCENSGQASPPPEGCQPAPGQASDTFFASTLQCEPFYMDWSGYCTTLFGQMRICYGGLREHDSCSDHSDCLDTLHVFHQGIVPGATYEIRSINVGDDISVERNYSNSLELTTSIWGDVVRNCATFPCGPPDGIVGIATDVTAMLDKFRNSGPPSVANPAILKVRADLDWETPNQLVDISDVTCCLDAFRGFDYPFPAPPTPPCP